MRFYDLNQDPKDLSDTESPIRRHTTTDMRLPTYILQRTAVLNSVREDVPNIGETWVPREWEGTWRWGQPFGDRGLEGIIVEKSRGG